MTNMNYAAAMIAVNKPGWFNPIDVDAACEFIIDNAPPSYIHCDHEANRKQAFVVRMANRIPFVQEVQMRSRVQGYYK